MRKLIHGVAFNSRGKYKTSGEHKVAYRTWKNMLERCYSKVIHNRHPTYIGCKVTEDWLDYQNFAQWFESNKYSNLGYHLDKDLLKPNNKIYSPKTCCFVPPELNSLTLDSGAARNGNPKGISFNKPMNKYCASMKVEGVRKHLGYFDCPNEAYAAYRSAKELHVKNKALEWRGKISDSAFKALMCWSLDS